MSIIWFVVAICLLPLLLSLLGIDFGSPKAPLDVAQLPTMAKHQLTDAMFSALRGAFHHTLLEWSAFSMAFVTVIAAFVYYKVSGEISGPIVGIALFMAGVMDAFHTLAADRLIHAVADNRNLIPFTWAICRLFNALILILGVSLFLLKKQDEGQGSKTRGMGFIVTISLLFGVIAYIIIHICATSQHLPQTQFPGSIITRPYDVVPMILYIIAGLFIFPAFYKKYPSIFAHALIISTIPQTATQAYMAFGSSSLFDNNFNIAHFLKIISYGVPLAGLLFDYIKTYHDLAAATVSRDVLKNEVITRKKTEDILNEANQQLRINEQELKQANEQLKQATAQLVQSEKLTALGDLSGGVAHELNQPLNVTKIACQSLLRDFKRDNVDLEEIKNDLAEIITQMDKMAGIIEHMRSLTKTKENEPKKELDINECIEGACKLVSAQMQAHHVQLSKTLTPGLPEVVGHFSEIEMVLLNILANARNALEDYQTEKKYITIKSFLTDDHKCVGIEIEDNGPGIPKEDIDKIYQPFYTNKQALSPDGLPMKGKGLGLSLVHKVIEDHNGQIKVNSEIDHGTTFTITLPAI